MKATRAGDDPVFLWVTIFRMVAPDDFEAAFNGFRTGITAEHGASKTIVDEALGKEFLARNSVKVGIMHYLTGLFLDGLDQMWMGMAKRADSNT